jgi:hypothetical protein
MKSSQSAHEFGGACAGQRLTLLHKGRQFGARQQNQPGFAAEFLDEKCFQLGLTRSDDGHLHRRSRRRAKCARPGSREIEKRQEDCKSHH